jgi:oligo-1,6-glucosidase
MEGYSLLHFKEVFSRWDSAFASKGWLSIFLANHDQARMVSRFGNDRPEFRDLSSKMLSTFIMTMRGTPYYYNGDELGMTNARFEKIEDYRDMPALNEYQNQKNIGGDLQKFIERLKFESRDNGRTPFQWDSTANAGFTSGTPWLKLNPNYIAINQAEQERDSNSCLNYFRSLTALRKANPALVYGKYTLLDKSNPNVYAYTREEGDQKLLIVLNFSQSNSEAQVTIPADAKVLLSNYSDEPVSADQESIKLRPYEALIFKF